MSSLFEAGPWDNAEAVAGVHVFDKKRKLLYGDEHDRAAHAEDPSAYSAPREEHRLHPLWRRGAIKYLQELCSKTKEEVKIPKKVGRAREKPWPGDLGKDHAVFEEFVAAGALSVHQDDSLGVYALVHRAALHRMADKYLNVDAPPAASAGAGAAAGAGAVAGPPFVAAAAFDGARAGYVFKAGSKGVGYYLDTLATRGGGGGGGGAAAAALAPLPPGWVEGLSPEGYPYFWHTETSTSSWARPTAATAVARNLALVPAQAAALRAAGPAALTKIAEQSGGVQISIPAGASHAVLRGPAAALDTAERLLRRKIEALVFAATAHPAAGAAAAAAAAAKAAATNTAATAPDYSFKGVAAHVALRDESAARLAEAQPAKPAAALSALAAAYGDSDDDDDA